MTAVDFRETLLGELRLLDSFGLYGELPDALQWAPRMPERISDAAMLRRVQLASAIWNLRMGYRRMQGALLKAMCVTSPEWDLFEEAV
jgi:hypothetical protein